EAGHVVRRTGLARRVTCGGRPWAKCETLAAFLAIHGTAKEFVLDAEASAAMGANGFHERLRLGLARRTAAILFAAGGLIVDSCLYPVCEPALSTLRTSPPPPASSGQSKRRCGSFLIDRRTSHATQTRQSGGSAVNSVKSNPPTSPPLPEA